MSKIFTSNIGVFIRINVSDPTYFNFHTWLLKFIINPTPPWRCGYITTLIKLFDKLSNVCHLYTNNQVEIVTEELHDTEDDKSGNTININLNRTGNNDRLC